MAYGRGVQRRALAKVTLAPIFGLGLIFGLWPGKHFSRALQRIAKLLQKFQQVTHGRFNLVIICENWWCHAFRATPYAAGSIAVPPKRATPLA